MSEKSDKEDKSNFDTSEKLNSEQSEESNSKTKKSNIHYPNGYLARIP
ncbi:MAG: hypothetical protein ACTSYI_00305 [Promethearchaeota archaeon]